METKTCDHFQVIPAICDLVVHTNSFAYVLPITCFPKNSIENVPKGVALRLRRICDSDDKFEERSVQYQKYLVARDYKVKLVKLKNSFQMSETFQGSKLGDLKTTIFQLHAT